MRHLVQLINFEQKISGETLLCASIWAAWFGTRDLQIFIWKWWLSHFYGMRNGLPNTSICRADYICATEAREPVFLCMEIQCIQYHSLSRGRERDSEHTQRLFCVSVQMNSESTITCVDKQGVKWGLTEELFSHKSKGMGCHIKAFLPATCLMQKETWLQTKCSYIILSEVYFLLLLFWQDNLWTTVSGGIEDRGKFDQA